MTINGRPISRPAQPSYVYRNGSSEAQPKMMRTNGKPLNGTSIVAAPSNPEINVAPLQRSNPADDEVKYNCALNTIMQYDKAEPEDVAFPEPSSPTRAAYLSRLGLIHSTLI